MEQVTNVIAVLSICFALMAVLAVSVEAIISWLKISIPWLQGKPSPEDVLKEVRGWLPDDNAEKQEARIVALNKALTAIQETPLSPNANVTLIVEKVGAATTKHIKLERNRRTVIRLLAIIIGFGVAVFFQIDTIQLLAPLSDSMKTFWTRVLGEDMNFLGILLSGLAANVGSGFWHDQSARLRKLKSSSQAVEELLRTR